jgi:hypothetical protein
VRRECVFPPELAAVATRFKRPLREPNPVEIDQLDLILIEPLPPHVWFQDMADFADGISDRAAARRLTEFLQGRGAFRRCKNQLYQPRL